MTVAEAVAQSVAHRVARNTAGGVPTWSVQTLEVVNPTGSVYDTAEIRSTTYDTAEMQGQD